MNTELLQRVASVLSWVRGYAESLTRSDDPKIADIGKDLLRALNEGQSGG
jgi:hypothetical protein